jgi:hypothetical protein
MEAAGLGGSRASLLFTYLYYFFCLFFNILND